MQLAFFKVSLICLHKCNICSTFAEKFKTIQYELVE